MLMFHSCNGTKCKVFFVRSAGFNSREEESAISAFPYRRSHALALNDHSELTRTKVKPRGLTKTDLTLLFKKSSKYLHCIDAEHMLAIMVRSSLSETEETKAFAWDLGNLEVVSHTFVVQVLVVCSTINFNPQFPII